MDKEEKNKYELMQGENKYIFETSIKEHSIHLSLTTSLGKIYSRYLSLADLQSLDKLFSSVQSEIQGLEYIDKVLKEQKVAVFEENQNLKLIFYITNEDVSNQIEIYFGDEMPKSIVDIPIKYVNDETDNININTELETNFEQKDIVDINQLNTGIENINNNMFNIDIYENNYCQNKDININNINNISTSTTTLPIKYLPTKIIKSKETYNYNIDNNYIPTPQEYSIPDYSKENINYIKEPSINIFDIQPKYNEIDSLLAELNELKHKEIESLKMRINEMKNFEKQQQEENNDLILRKKKEEVEKLKKEYDFQIEELRKTQKPQKINPGLDSKNITFQEKSEKVCVKGNIIHSPLELELITRKINAGSPFNKKLRLNLLYKASVDTDKASAFHNKCNKAKSTLILIETDKGKRFGGYTSTNWEGNCVEKKDKKAFVFSLDKMKIFDNIPGEYAIGCYPKFGPIFMGCQIRINDNAFIKGGTTFEKGMNFNTEEDYELNGGERVFKIKDIEVYEVIIHKV